MIGQSTRYEPTYTVRRPGDQYGFVFNVHTLPRTVKIRVIISRAVG
jgi:hypothetical protein